ncbi:MAG TPA: 50S ribosomal protein L22 [Nitrospiria bacterium]|nr:50S ribosomal protein L22 [Candidatus Manganitrophaceae bacterium]HIL35523.1 50S ribosomal protein L22 [Candidatus Manganitrophaceae bacterium]
MEAKVILRYIRIAPRKARLVADLVRGKNAEEAFTILKFTPRRGAMIIEKILKSAVANASQKEMGDVDTLKISRVFVDCGPTMKRMRPRAMGRANTILKRTSHITLVLSGEEAAKKDRKATSAPVKQKKTAPVKKTATSRKSPASGKKAAPKKDTISKKEVASKKGSDSGKGGVSKKAPASKKVVSPKKETATKKPVVSKKEAPPKKALPKKKKDADSQKEK